MRVCHDPSQVETAFKGVHGPTLVDRFLQGAVEIDVDALCDGERTYIGALMQHVEEAGVHSGDSACVLPAQSVGSEATTEIQSIVRRLGLHREGRIRRQLNCAPDGCLALAELTADTSLPRLEEADSLVTRLKADRERLGGVNLQADDDLTTMTEQFEGMDKEKSDVEEAIAKLRSGIAQLNDEGQSRLQEAFDTVNGHFQRLFTTLFGGGEARLEMVEGEDPLENGLEIVAKPPGKKPATLSLLSGGEQTLTALALIFAVFLTNPSPICVLDEV